jgi:hypothetical protein
MTIYTLGHQSEGFIELRSADSSDSGYEASMTIRYEPKSVRDRWRHPPVDLISGIGSAIALAARSIPSGMKAIRLVTAI